MNLTVMTYNIRIGTWNPLGLEGIARVVEQVQPDILGMQEIQRFGWTSGPIDQTEWLSERLNMNAVFGPARPTNDPWWTAPGEPGTFGNALLSKFPVRASHTLALPQPTDADETRAVLGVALDTPSGPLNAFVTHWSLDADLRQAAAPAMIDFTRTFHPGAPVVLIGDFNAEPDALEIATLRAGLRDVADELAIPMEDRYSFPSGPKGCLTPAGWTAALDHFFISPEFTIAGFEVIHDTQASDHKPVVVRLGFEPQT